MGQQKRCLDVRQWCTQIHMAIYLKYPANPILISKCSDLACPVVLPPQGPPVRTSFQIFFFCCSAAMTCSRSVYSFMVKQNSSVSGFGGKIQISFGCVWKCFSLVNFCSDAFDEFFKSFCLRFFLIGGSIETKASASRCLLRFVNRKDFLRSRISCSFNVRERG